MGKYSLGLDFGTESVRAILVNIITGHIFAQAQTNYPHGVLDRTLPSSGKALGPDVALQHPLDWLSSLEKACKKAIKAGKISPDDIVGIGVDFTSCTMLPCKSNGTPLCLLKHFEHQPDAWPKLWKHHAAHTQTDRMNQVAHDRNEEWLSHFGGIIGLEWFFPKTLEVLENAPAVYRAADLFIEAGDWLVWQLTSGPFPDCNPDQVPRSSCQAGYKALWNKQTGYPSSEYFRAVNPKFEHVVRDKMRGTIMPPGQCAGFLSATMARRLGLRARTPISAAIIDAHAGVPGSGVHDAGTMVLVMGTSACHMINAEVEKTIKGVAGVVADGILPGYFGYETGQASVGDAFAWVARLVDRDHAKLNQLAEKLPPGSGGVMALDWLNGCRTPLMDGRLSGALIGLTLQTQPEQIYRAMLEAAAMGLKWIIDTLVAGGVPVKRFVASGGLPAKSPLLMQICADVLGIKIQLAASDQSVALGAAILGCIAAGEKTTGYKTIAQAIKAMGKTRDDLHYLPDPKRHKQYTRLYALYRKLAAGNTPAIMRELRGLDE